MKGFLVVFLLLFVSVVHADLLSVSKKFSEYNRQRTSLGFDLGTHIVPKSLASANTDGFGLQRLGGQIHSSQELVKGFEVLSSIVVGGASYGKMLSDDETTKSMSGLYLGSEIGFRYLYEVNDAFDVGGMIAVNYDTIMGFR